MLFRKRVDSVCENFTKSCEAKCRTLNVAECRALNVAECRALNIAECRALNVAECRALNVAECASVNVIEKTNKMRPCSRIYYSNVS